MKKYLFLSLILIAAACGGDESLKPIPPDQQGTIQDPKSKDNANSREQTCIGSGLYNWLGSRTHVNYPTKNPSIYTLQMTCLGDPLYNLSLNGCEGVSGYNIMQPDATLGYNSNIEFTLLNGVAGASGYTPLNYDITGLPGWQRGYHITGTLASGQNVKIRAKLPLAAYPSNVNFTITYKLTPACVTGQPGTMTHMMTWDVVNSYTPQQYVSGLHSAGATWGSTCP